METFGGLIEGKLEPSVDASLLDELEKLSEQLQAKPDIADRLKVFTESTKNEDFEPKKQTHSANSRLEPIRQRKKVRGPSL